VWMWEDYERWSVTEVVHGSVRIPGKANFKLGRTSWPSIYRWSTSYLCTGIKGVCTIVCSTNMLYDQLFQFTQPRDITARESSVYSSCLSSILTPLSRIKVSSVFPESRAKWRRYERCTKEGHSNGTNNFRTKFTIPAANSLLGLKELNDSYT
jgi:hypothetical protein